MFTAVVNLNAGDPIETQAFEEFFAIAPLIPTKVVPLQLSQAIGIFLKKFLRQVNEVRKKIRFFKRSQNTR